MTTGTNDAGDRPLTAADILAAAGITEPPLINVTPPHGILAITEAINDGAIPSIYVRNGALVHLTRISAAVDTTPVAAVDLTADSLQRLLAQHTRTVRIRHTQNGAEHVPTMPPLPMLRAVLSAAEWPRVRPLRGVVTAPVIRADGTILQTEGYDPASGYYYAPVLPVPPIPDNPSPTDIATAKNLLLDTVLVDFPWANDASRTNYVALLVTPLLRTYIGGLSPLGAITATTPGSGKTLLAELVGRLYGYTSRPWVDSDTELRKALTAVLATSSDPVVIFDNVGEFDAVEQPTLAKLLTSLTWHDRALGSSNQIGVPNDRTWLVTGNNIRFGGDIPSRTVLVELDPRMPNPDQRSGFRIPDLADWLDSSENRGALLYHLLVLVRAWIVAGAPTIATPMRTFRRWASAMRGFVEFCGLSGFLANRDSLETHDDDAVIWQAFLATWYRRHGDNRLTASDLLADARPQWTGTDHVDPWGGAFLTNRRGEQLTVRGLGMMLASRRGRFFGPYVLHAGVDRTKTRVYWVTRQEDA